MSAPVLQCLLDMDGVLADFNGGMLRAHGGRRVDPNADRSNWGKWEIHEIWGIQEEEFWAPIDADRFFWQNLDKTPEADRIVELAVRQFGEQNVAVLTAPSFGNDCIPGKRWWITTHYPFLTKRLIFGHAKEFLAAPTRVLVDDRDRNIDRFEAAGGVGVQVPRMWNRKHQFQLNNEVFEYVEEEMSFVLKVMRGEIK